MSTTESLSLQNKLRIGLLSGGHFVIDCYSTALGCLLPLLIAKHHLSYTAAGILGALLIFSSSIMQPVYGYISDRYLKRGFSISGPAVTALFISSLGLAPTYAWTLGLLILGGAGIASFHPQSAALAVQSSGRRQGIGMSIFVTAGSIGYALGPIYFSTVIKWTGLERLYWAALPGLVISLLLLAKCPALEQGERAASNARLWSDLKSVWRPMTILYFLVVLRSAVQIVFVQFLPTYLLQRGYSLEQASQILSLYLFFGGIGGFAGGALADRFGGRRVIAYSMLLATPICLGFMFTHGALSLGLLALGGLVLLFTTPVNVVMGQNLIPRNASTVSALLMGFAWGMSGIVCMPLVGKLADTVGLHHAMISVIMLPCLGYLLARQLPGQDTKTTTGPTPVGLAEALPTSVRE